MKKLLSVLSVSALLSGCGAVTNLVCAQAPMGGTMVDTMGVVAPFATDKAEWYLCPLAILDFGPTLILDLGTLPFTLLMTWLC